MEQYLCDNTNINSEYWKESKRFHLPCNDEEIASWEEWITDTADHS